MPVIAIGAAIVADAVAVSAAVAGTITTFGVIAAVGATVGAIGAVTHNKVLETIGMAAGAVGGIGAIASSAGLFGAASASSIFGSDAAAGASSLSDFGISGLSDAGNVAAGGDVIDTLSNAVSGAGDAASSDLASFGISGLSDAGNVAVAPAGLVNSTGAINTDAINPVDTISNQTNQAAGTTEGVANNINAQNGLGAPDVVSSPQISDVNLLAAKSEPVPSATDQLGGAQPTTGQPTPAPTPDQVTAMPPSSVTPAAGQVTGAPLSDAPTGAGSNVTGVVDNGDFDTSVGKGAGSGGVLNGLMGFVEKHPSLAFGAAQAAGSFLSGATSTLTPAQVNALNAQAAANNAVAALTKQQTSSMAQPKSVATLAPVTGKPAPLITPTAPPGLINVTGAPA